MAFQIFYPYINTDENVPSDHSDNDDENQPMNMENILENIKKLHNNLPNENKKFRPEVVKEMTEKILEEELDDLSYDPVKCRQKSKELSDRIRDAVKELGLERYKFVCTVSIGSLEEQGFRLGSRCLWFSLTDASATAVFKNSSLFAVAIVFGVYME